MSNSFDLLDQLGDQQKIDALKAKIEKKKSDNVSSKLDEIESKIEEAASEQRSPEEIINNIIDSNFKTINKDAQETEKDLQELMLHLRSMLDSCGGEFAQLQELNEEEAAIVERAKNAIKKAESDLKDAEDMSGAWNILFGMKNRKLKQAREDLEFSESNVERAAEKANKMYRDRLKNADIGESLNRIISQVQGMIGILEDEILEVDSQIGGLKNRKEISFSTKEKAANVMRERKSALEQIESKLENSEKELVELANNTPEHTAKQKEIADLREERAELKGKYNIALGIFESKERFVDQIVVHLEAQTTIKNNLKQLIGQLKSDTEERVTTYQSGLQLIQSATAQEAASIYEEAGVKTDQKITEIAAKVFIGSEKDRIERQKKHPERLTELHNVLIAMAEATAKYKEEDSKLAEEHSKKFGLDMTDTFSSQYEKKESKKEESNDSDGGDASNDVDDLLS